MPALGRRARLTLGCLLVGVLALALVAAAWWRLPTSRPTPGLLAGARVVAAPPGLRAERLTDGVAAPTGALWNGPHAAVLPAPGGGARGGAGAPGAVVWDLGAPHRVRSAYLQGDDNDAYRLSGSLDGQSWTPLWQAPLLHAGGARGRWSGPLDTELRYLRLDSPEGDGSRSVSEVALWEEPPPRATATEEGVPTPERRRGALLAFGAALIAAILVIRRGSGVTWGVATLLVVAGAAELVVAWLGREAAGPREVALVRGVAAAVALAAVLWPHLAPAGWPASRRATGLALVVAAALGIAGFFNLFRPQFWDHERARPSAVHCHDMRVYYPVAKYFPELGFDGVYLASVAALIDDVPGTTVASLGAVSLRDLRTHRMVRVTDVAPAVEAVRRRFTPERWTAFREDMRYFRLRMGRDGYLGSLHDHGGNATPVWLTVAHALFARTTATDAVFLGGALLDPLLLLLAFVALGRSYGWRAAVTCAVVFGANDFYMFGSNWVGATLRHDWMAYLALGFAALRVERWVLGGALLALAGMIRAFPAVTLLTVGLPLLGWALDTRRAQGRWPRPRQLWGEQRWCFRVALGAALAVLVGLAVSSALLGPAAWTAWLHKVQLLDGEPHTNHESLRALVGGSTSAQGELLRARWPVFAGGVIAMVALVVAAARRAPPDRAAVLGLCLIPVAFNPANYYLHVLFLLPLLGAAVAPRGGPAALPGGPPADPLDAARGAWVSGAALALCAAQYFTVLERDEALHFYQSTVLLFGCLLLTLGAVARLGWPPRAPASEPAGGPATGAPPA